MLVLFLIVAFMLMFMGKRAVCLVFMSMAGAVPLMGMIMLVLEGMGVAVVVLVLVAMFFCAMLVTMFMVVVMLVGMDVLVRMFSFAHGLPLWLSWLVSVLP